MSKDIMQKVSKYKKKDIKGVPFSVLLKLAEHSDKNGLCRTIKIRTLSYATRFSQETVYECLKQLETDGFIEIKNGSLDLPNSSGRELQINLARLGYAKEIV